MKPYGANGNIRNSSQCDEEQFYTTANNNHKNKYLQIENGFFEALFEQLGFTSNHYALLKC